MYPSKRVCTRSSSKEAKKEAKKVAKKALECEFKLAWTFFLTIHGSENIGIIALKLIHANDNEKRNLINMANQPRYANFFNQFKQEQLRTQGITPN